LKKRRSRSRPRPEAPAAAPVAEREEHLSPFAADAGGREQILARAESTAAEPSLLPTESAAPEEARPEPPAPLLPAPQADAVLPLADAPADTASPEPAPAELPVLPPADPPEEPPHSNNAEPAPAHHEAAPMPAIPVASLAAPVAAFFPAPAAVLVGNAGSSALEERVRRLEEALARLESQRCQAPKPAEQVQRERPSGSSTTARILDVGKRMFGPSEPKPAPAAPAAPQPHGGRRPWLLFEMLAEARAIFRMYFDPRYRLSWFGRIVPLVLVAAIVTSWWWVPLSSIFVFGNLLDKAVDLVLAFMLFKVLGQEARRYRETSPDLPPHLRL
jgi:hypothetical protein